MILAFTVYGTAVPKGNMRAIQLRGMKSPIVTDSNRNVKSWSQLIAEGASHALNALPATERVLFPHGVRVSIAFYLPRPKKWNKRGVFVPHCVAPDIDKLERAVLDALSGVIYHDDRQVTEVVKGKYYTEVDQPAHVNIRVEPAPEQKLMIQPLRTPLFDGDVLEARR